MPCSSISSTAQRWAEVKNKTQQSDDNGVSYILLFNEIHYGVPTIVTLVHTSTLFTYLLVYLLVDFCV